MFDGARLVCVVASRGDIAVLCPELLLRHPLVA